MQITISNISSPQTLMLDVPADITIADLKALIAAEFLPPAAASSSSSSSTQQLTLYHNGKKIGDANKSLQESGIQDGDMVVVHATSGGSGSSGSSASRRGTPAGGRGESGSGVGGGGGGERGNPQHQRGLMEPDAEMIRLQVLGDPRLMDELRRSQPQLAEAVSDPARFRREFEALEEQRKDAERQKQREIALLDEDPFNPEAQAKIAELIRQEQVMENLQSALEHNPEAFGKVIMLYIPVEVNGHPIKAFVDSGAQATIMSPRCAEQCNIMRLIDARFAGIARGVGTANILGRVHSAQIKIGSLFLACSFTVMEGKDVDLLLGLDMLKRHQAKIDLERNCLVIGGSEVRFLGEADIPKAAWERDELRLGEEPTVEGPGGARIGGRTGALVSGPSGGPGGGPPPPPPPPPTPGSSIPTPLLRETPGAYTPSPSISSPQPQQHYQPPSIPHGQQQQLLQQQHTSPPPLPGRGDTGGFSEEAIGQLMNLGFSRQEAVAALQLTGGDVDMAASLLFN